MQKSIKPVELVLFAGAGGGVLAGLLLDHDVAAYVEINPFCQEVLRRRMGEGHIPEAPIFNDVRELDGTPFRGKVDLLSGGPPCQPFSLAGKRKAGDDARDMWPDTLRLVREVRPRRALLENVPGLLTGGRGYFGHVLGELAESGYDAVWTTLSAADVGAPHVRNRLWILASRVGD